MVVFTHPEEDVLPFGHSSSNAKFGTLENEFAFPAFTGADNELALELPASELASERLEISQERVYLAAKRTLDIVLSGLAIVLISPVLALIAAVIRLCSSGPAIYRHVRVGEGGREFTCFKFRTMVVDADDLKQVISDQNVHQDSRTFKLPEDPRVTRLGKLLRRASLDELPQLFNVLLGDMSLVGPRPPLPSEVEQYTLDDMRRLSVKPGVTCIWQVSGRSDIPFPQQLEMDLDYIRRRNLWLDLDLLCRTIPAVISAKGAY